MFWQLLAMLGIGVVLLITLLLTVQVGHHVQWVQFPDSFNFYSRIVLYYSCLTATSIICTVASPAIWLLNGGPAVSLLITHLLCSLWFDWRIEVRGGIENLRAHSLASNASLGGGSSSPRSPTILVANHQSSLDLLIMATICRGWWGGAALAKDQLKWVPLLNATLASANTIFVSNKNAWGKLKGGEDNNGNGGPSSQFDAQYIISKLLRDRIQWLWIFAEGRRHREGGGMLPFRKGAFNIAVASQFPIVPVVISDISPFYSRTMRYFYSKGLVICQILEPIETQGLCAKDVPVLCERVRDEMLKAYDRINAEVRQRTDAKIVT